MSEEFTIYADAWRANRMPPLTNEQWAAAQRRQAFDKARWMYESKPRSSDRAIAFQLDLATREALGN